MTAVFLKEPGDHIGHYRVRRFLGAGCEGQVYLAVDLRDGALRTVKLFSGRDMVRDARHTAAHYRKLASVVTLKRFLEWGVLPQQRGVGDRPWLAFDYIRGETLASRIAERRIGDPLRVLIKVCDALSPLHRRGVAIGDFDRERNLLVQRGTGLVLFCDLDAGSLEARSPGLEEDREELLRLARKLWRELGQRSPMAVLDAIANTEDAVQAGKRLRKLFEPRARPP